MRRLAALLPLILLPSGAAAVRAQSSQAPDAPARVEDAVSAEEIARTLDGIDYDRTGGREGERRAAAFLEERLRQYGIAHRRHDIRVHLSWPVSASLAALNVAPKAFKALAVTFGASTPAGGVVGEAVWLEGALPDAARLGSLVRGRIAIVSASSIYPEDSVWAVQAAGAIGLVQVSEGDVLHEDTASSIWGTPTTESASKLPAIPVITIGRSDGERLRTAGATGPLTLRVTARVDRGWATVPLVMADVAGSRPEFVLVTTHVDAWYRGMTDTGGTVASILEMARVLQQQPRLTRGVRFAWWPGHSFGRYAGSAWYVDHFWTDLDRHCVAYTNLDGAGRRGSRVDAIVAGGWPGLADFSHRFAETRLGKTPPEAPTRLFRPGRDSDSAFQGLGIPEFFVGVPGPPKGHPDVEPNGTIVYWHTPDDTRDKIDLAALTLDTRYRLAQIHELATAPTLPHQLAPIALSYRRAIEALQSAAGPAFDLEPAARAAARLETFATEVDRLPRPSAEPARLSLDRVLVRVTKRLNSTLYTRAGRFEQDPAATLPLLPRLARAAELAALPRDGDAFGFLEVELLRGRNQVVATLTEAADEIEHYLEAVRGETR